MTETPNTPAEPFSFACNLHAVPGDLRAQHSETTRTLFAQISNTLRLEDGYQFQFPRNPDIIQNLGKFISLESQCCSFFTFGLQVLAGEDRVMLNLLGPAGIHAFIEQTFLTSSP